MYPLAKPQPTLDARPTPVLVAPSCPRPKPARSVISQLLSTPWTAIRPARIRLQGRAGRNVHHAGLHTRMSFLRYLHPSLHGAAGCCASDGQEAADGTLTLHRFSVLKSRPMLTCAHDQNFFGRRRTEDPPARLILGAKTHLPSSSTAEQAFPAVATSSRNGPPVHASRATQAAEQYVIQGRPSV